MRTMLVAVAVAIAAFFGIIGAFFFVAGLGGSAELGYSHFYTKVSGVPSPISRSALIVAGIMFLILAVYTLFLLRRLSSPNVASQGSLDAISGVGVGVRWLLIFLLIAAGLAVYGELAPPPNPPLPRQAATVKEFIAAINRKDYAEARALGGKNVGIPYSKFVSGFATTAYDRWVQKRLLRQSNGVTRLFELERGRCMSRLLWVIHAGVPAAWPGGAVAGGA
jgi:hypothetical protein